MAVTGSAEALFNIEVGKRENDLISLRWENGKDADCFVLRHRYSRSKVVYDRLN